MTPAAEVIERVYREDWGRLLAGLIAAIRDFDLAEEGLQEAFAAASERWPREGVPSNPGGWLALTARRKVIDRVRRENVGRQKREAAALAERIELAGRTEDDEEAPAVPDDRLRLMFTCCHPALALDARVALTLRTLGGLTTREIARAFLLPEATLAQRLVRAKRKIRDAGIPYRVPADHDLPERLDGVLAVLYLVFTEGYAATDGPAVVRADLCQEAIRLARLLAALMPDEPEAHGLLALMLLHDSRRATRCDEAGDIVLLEDQDRTRWDHGRIAEGVALLERCGRMRRPGVYQLQAAIAAVHAEAGNGDNTDWPQIAALYGALARIAGSPVVELNRAVAIAMARGPEPGLAMLDDLALAAPLGGYHLYHAARADMLRRLCRWTDARDAYGRALELATNAAERRFLERRLAALPRGDETL